MQNQNNQVLYTVDVMITICKKNIVLIKRAKFPFQDKLVLPGGHIEKDEDFEMACIREVAEEVGLDISNRTLSFVKKLSEPDRDPRPQPRISYVFWVDFDCDITDKLCAGSDAQEVCVMLLSELTSDDIGFDHWEVIKMLV